jgi:hypothetical protein
VTAAQADLLRRLIAADRRGVEVGWISGVNPRTANALVDLDLIELVNLHHGQTWAFLGKYAVHD